MVHDSSVEQTLASRPRIANGASETQRRLFRSEIGSEAVSLAADLACLSARFSFKDLPDFLDIACRGDLSDTAGPLIYGGLVGPDSFDHTPQNMRFLPHRGGPRVYRKTRWEPSHSGLCQPS